MTSHHRISAIAVLACLGGCASTPEPVLALAEKSSATAGVVGARLRQLAQASDALYARRAASVAHLHAVNAAQRASLEYDLALTRKVGQDAELTQMKELQAWTAEVDKLFASAAGAEKSRREELAAAQVKIDTGAQALQQVAQTLTSLAQKESAGERAKLMAAFASEVRDDVKRQLDDGTKSAAAAKALLDQLKADKPRGDEP
jgi:hypothetical protein